MRRQPTTTMEARASSTATSDSSSWRRWRRSARSRRMARQRTSRRGSFSQTLRGHIPCRMHRRWLPLLDLGEIVDYYLGIDVSTTSSKALLIDGSGTVLAVASSAHTLQTPKPLWSEQDPAEWWQAASASIHSVLKKAGVSGERIEAIGLPGQMHGLVLLDEAGKVLRPAILWNDQRTQSQCDEIHELIGKQRFIQITGNVALTGFTAPKILWVKENEPEVFAKSRHVLLPKDYVRYRLTDAYAMDKADGAGTVLFDLKLRDWSH